MRTIRVSSLIFALSLSFGSLYGQTEKIATVSSSYPVTIPAASALNISSVTLSVSYPTGLTPGSYVSGTQLNTDFQAFLTAYPSQTDPLEAILSTVLQSILNKYPQMTGGTIDGELPGTYMGYPEPGAGGSVIVEIGTYNLGSLTGLSRHPAKPKPSPSPSH